MVTPLSLPLSSSFLSRPQKKEEGIHLLARSPNFLGEGFMARVHAWSECRGERTCVWSSLFTIPGVALPPRGRCHSACSVCFASWILCCPCGVFVSSRLSRFSLSHFLFSSPLSRLGNSLLGPRLSPPLFRTSLPAFPAVMDAAARSTPAPPLPPRRCGSMNVETNEPGAYVYG